jgi:hypothetical protein
MPGGYEGEPLTLYRGTDAPEQGRRISGFSWSTDKAIARRFAERWASVSAELRASGFQPALTGGGVLMRALAPAAAILLMREPEDYYDEGEVVVDPYRLGRIELIERLHCEKPRDENRVTTLRVWE